MQRWFNMYKLINITEQNIDSETEVARSTQQLQKEHLTKFLKKLVVEETWLNIIKLP